ncbi:hypothetical protein KCP76_06320 [Salmonella enterica subsp. enterica serovar Weltevreden]|nr:hypothetical protein KCP76_06320 [Salmonella enterica subsp. enterica serovar Weltevreden]
MPLGYEEMLTNWKPSLADASPAGRRRGHSLKSCRMATPKRPIRLITGRPDKRSAIETTRYADLTCRGVIINTLY